METTPALRPLKVVIAYETPAAAVRAKEISQRLTAELNSSCDLWSMESLIHLPLRQLAATAASEAHIVVIAARNAEALPIHLKDWIEDWLARKKRGPTALVALYDEERETPRETPQEPSLGTFLGLIAERGGMDFLSNAGDRRLPDFQNTKEIHPHRAKDECAAGMGPPSPGRGNQSATINEREPCKPQSDRTPHPARNKLPAWPAAFGKRPAGPPGATWNSGSRPSNKSGWLPDRERSR